MVEVDLLLEWRGPHPLSKAAVDSDVADDEGGVYLLGCRGHAFYVGQGNVADRLRVHASAAETNKCIQARVAVHDCWFYWARVSPSNLDGVEAYLVHACRENRPVNECCNQVQPQAPFISVNGPPWLP